MSSDSLPQTSIVVRPAVSISLSSHFLLSSFTSILFAAEMDVSLCIWDVGRFQWIFWQLLPLILSQVADDTQGKGILDELKVDGVDTSFMVLNKTRACIHTP
ncbi:hypothetical protein K1719_045603 [Acacia pycnantha]|nr:hypothetical protein K1719_045603 [Acacia pycnantha]